MVCKNIHSQHFLLTIGLFQPSFQFASDNFCNFATQTTWQSHPHKGVWRGKRRRDFSLKSSLFSFDIHLPQPLSENVPIYKMYWVQSTETREFFWLQPFRKGINTLPSGWSDDTSYNMVCSEAHWGALSETKRVHGWSEQPSQRG